jgi:hypothetical protein
MPTYLNPTYRLVTTLTGLNETSLSSVASDVDGNIYTVGSFGSSGANICMPSGISSFDIQSSESGVLIKSNKNGTTLFRTYFESNTSAHVVTDSFSNAYVCSNGSVMRFTDSGDLMWNTHISNATVTDIVIDSKSNTYICGNYDVGGAFIARIDYEGNIASTNSIQDVTASSISIDSESNVYVACTVPSNGGVYIAKYTHDGSYVWKGSIEGNVYATSSHVSSSHAYISGTSPGFVVQYTLEDGAPCMSVHTDGTCTDIATSCSNIFICGSYGPYTSNIYINTECKTSLPQTDGGCIGGYMIRIDEDGNVVWQVTVSGESDVIINSLTVDEYQNSYITGTYGPGTALLHDTIGSRTPLGVCTCVSGFLLRLDANGMISFLHST